MIFKFIRKLRNIKKTIYRKEAFNPGFIGVFMNPFYFERKGLYKNISALLPNLSGKVLDIGCGQKPYKKLCFCDEYIGLEIDSPGNRKLKNADFFYDGEVMPFESETFDSAFSSQVFEHVFNPDCFLQEINRVMKKGGIFLMAVPFAWDEHEQPYDYARYSSFGLRHILKKNGFEVIEQRKSCNYIEVIFQFVNAYLCKKVKPKGFLLKVLINLCLMGPITIIGLIFSKILPSDNDLYLDNIVLVKKI